MPSKNQKPITEGQWLTAADAYELGTKHASQIAQELGVSPATVSRQFKRRRCVKARRVAEIVAAIEAELDAKDRIRARQRQAEEAAVAARSAALDELIGGMVRSLIAADRAGNLAAVGPAMEKTRKSLGIKALR